ncbi:MAG: apolipoprotein N-acyltransferase [Armatimonadota bacterium]|nr:apolipoprotein N-acyltransferase [Armatimonadota bacterium]
MTLLFGILASAIVSALAHPPAGIAWLILVAPAPLFALTLHTRARRGFAYGWLWSFVYYLTLGHPLIYLIRLQTDSLFLSVLGLTLVAGISALLFGGLFGLLVSQMPRNLLGILGAAGAWTLTQYLRGLGPYAFVWGHWSVALYKLPVLLQPAEWVGAWGLEFLIALWNGLLVYAWWLGQARAWRALALLGVVATVAWLSLIGFGSARIGQWNLADARLGQTTRLVALVQPNVDLARTYTPEEWSDIRKRIAQQVRQASQISPPWRTRLGQPPRPDLIVLPEVIELFPMPQSQSVFRFWQSLAQELGTPLLVGGYRVAQSEPRRVANTMHLFLPDGSWHYHDKLVLVPFGEHVPFRRLLPFVHVFGVVEEDMYAGSDLRPLPAGDLRVGTVICMESTYPWVARGMANAGANLIVVGSNESWFGRTAALEQHLAFAVLRAIETRRWVVRCAPEGISVFIAPSGEIRKRVPPFTATAVALPVHPRDFETFYVRWGDWAAWLGAGLGLLVALSTRACTAWSRHKKLLLTRFRKSAA